MSKHGINSMSWFYNKDDISDKDNCQNFVSRIQRQGWIHWANTYLMRTFVPSSIWLSWMITSSSSLLLMSNLYCGLSKKVVGWFKQPPALSGLLHAETLTYSFHVLENEKSDVLMRWLIDTSVNWMTKSSHGILRIDNQYKHESCLR